MKFSTLTPAAVIGVVVGIALGVLTTLWIFDVSVSCRSKNITPAQARDLLNNFSRESETPVDWYGGEFMPGDIGTLSDCILEVLVDARIRYRSFDEFAGVRLAYGIESGGDLSRPYAIFLPLDESGNVIPSTPKRSYRVLAKKFDYEPGDPCPRYCDL